jgi:hypothetical protein
MTPAGRLRRVKQIKLAHDLGPLVGKHRVADVAPLLEARQFFNRIGADRDDAVAALLHLGADPFKADHLLLAERAPIGGAGDEQDRAVFAGERSERTRCAGFILGRDRRERGANSQAVIM